MILVVFYGGGNRFQVVVVCCEGSGCYGLGFFFFFCYGI